MSIEREDLGARMLRLQQEREVDVQQILLQCSPYLFATFS
jgi:hypothetical protein